MTTSTSSTTVGTTIDVTVTAEDSQTNSVVTGYGGTVHFTSSDTNTQAVLPDDYMFLPTDGGTHTFTGGVTFATSGSQTVTATEVGDNSTTRTSGPVTVAPGSVDHFVLGSPSPSGQAGVQSTVSVAAFDAYGNPTTDSLGSPVLSSTLHGSNTGCSGPCAVSQSLGGFAPDGTATITFTAYRAETGRTLTVTAGNGAHNDSAGFGVAPAALDHFEFGTPTPAAQAGVQSTVALTAFDKYENPTTDSLGSPVLSSTLHGSNTGCLGPCTLSQSLGGFAPDGTATITFTAYRAETGRTLTVTSGSVQDSTDPFDVAPGPLASFDWSTQQPATPQTAGTAFVAKVTAVDQFGNVKTDYTGSTATFSGLENAPNGTQTASYGVSWGSGTGVATLSAKTYKTEVNPPGIGITVTDAGGIDAKSNTFGVNPGPLGSFDWSTQQPATPQTAGTAFPAKVTAVDQFGNVKTDYTGSTATFSGLENAPNGTQTASYGVSWGSGTGVATVSAKTYKTEVNPPGIGITVTDTGGIHATSNTFAVNPGPLGSFDWTAPTSQQPGPSQLAGTAFGAKVTAVDTYGNVKTDYPGTDTPTFAGLHDAPNGSHIASYAVTWNGGVASGSFTGYKTEPGPLPGGGTALTVKNGAGTIQAISSKFVVDPADPATINFLCASLCREPVETQVNAIINNGLVPPGVRALISDGFGNAAYNSQVNAFLDNQAVAITGNPTGGTFTLSYVGSPTAALPFNATATQVQNAMNAVGAVSSAGGVTVTGGALPGLPLLVSFNQAGAHNLFTHADSLTGGSSPAVTITRSVFTGGSTTTVAANSSGIAVFTNLAIPTTAAGYRISASASRTPTSTITANGASVPFTVAQAVNPCTGSTCSASASVPNNTTVSVTANGATSGNTLGVALFGAVIPPGVCSGFTPVAGVPLSFVNLNLLSTGGQHPTLTLTWTLAKAIVNAQPDNGAAHYNMCLGAVNLANPQNSPPIQGFVTKSGARATPVPDPLFGVTLFWGILGNCNKVPAGNPCVVSRGKDSAGNLIFVYQVAYPWDPNGSLG